jgi:hypothetical protein
MDLFNIYYINYQKVYEIAMMENNRIRSHITNERLFSAESAGSLKTSTSAKVGFPFASVKTDMGFDAISSETRSSKFIESIEIKTTKSVLLHRIIKNCKSLQKFEGVATEGDLIKIDNVELRIMDEASLRQILFLRRDALKGIRVEGIEINNLITSLLSDYAYILIGKVGDEELVIKIPAEAQSEFESKYNVDDLLIGKVSIIGVYKAKVSEKAVTKNTFTFMAEVGSALPTVESRIIDSNQAAIVNNGITLNQYCEDSDLHYIDVFAIVQDVKHKEVEEQKPVKKKCFLRRIFSRKKP